MPDLTRLLPARGPLRTYALVTLVDSTGLGLYTTGSVLFFTRGLGLSASFVGLGLTVAALVGLLASVPAGRLADRRTRRGVLVPFYAAQAVLFALFPLVHGRVSFLAVVCGVALAESGARPVRRALLSDLVTGADRVRASAYNRAVLNVGVSVGAVGAGGALALGSRAAYDALVLGNAVSFAVAGVLLAGLQVPPAAPAGAEPTGSAARGPFRDLRFVALALSCGLLYLSASLLDVALPLQITGHTAAPAWVYAPLLLLNTGMAITLQVRASRGSETVAGAATANRRAGAALLGACVLFPLATLGGAIVAIGLLVLTTVLLTVGELLSSAGSWGLSYELAPAARQAEWLGAFGVLSQLAQVPGPALAVQAVHAGALGWILLGLGFLTVGLASPALVRARPSRALPAA